MTPYGNTDLSWSTLAQVMAWCLTAPSHYLDQGWLITTSSRGQWVKPSTFPHLYPHHTYPSVRYNYTEYTVPLDHHWPDPCGTLEHNPRRTVRYNHRDRYIPPHGIPRPCRSLAEQSAARHRQYGWCLSKKTTINPLYTKLFWWNIYIFPFAIISRQWDGTDSLNTSLW